MALVLGLTVGEDFFIDGHRMVVDEICTNQSFWVVAPDGSRSFINDRRSTELRPSVMASAGKGTLGKVRLALTAPTAIKIVRGDLMRGDQ